nr:ribonuclease H-like domain-containing protein [Tanacetum cinerariifolium]
MESLNPQVVAAAKLHILSPNEFDLWKMRIEQYFFMTDYSLWEVILNGDSPPPTRIVDGVVQIVAPTTAKQRLAKKNKLKARGTLLMALPDKYQLNFNIHKDAKSLMEAIEKRFRESLDQIHDRLQKLISQLEILDKTITQKDINLKFLRSLPSEWKTHTLIWRYKADLEEQILDDLFNNLKIYEAELKGSSHSSQNTKNIAFMSSNNTDNTNESVNAAPSVSAASSKAKVYTLPNVDGLSDAETENRVPKNLKNDRYKTGEGYHAVPTPYTGTFLPPKPDLVFTDDPNASESVDNVFNVESSINKPSKDMSKTHRPDVPIVKD